MKIVIIGFSGSGKSTLSKLLGKHYNIEILHLDKLQFLPNWEVQDKFVMEKQIIDFMDKNDQWVIEGNYKVASRRFVEADLCIYLALNRFVCLKGVIVRYFKNKGKTRDDMAKHCPEKLDISFLWWVFHKGRNKVRKKRLNDIILNSKNGVIIKSRRKLKKFLKELNVEVK